MKAYLLYETGGVEQLVYSDIEQPQLKEGEVLVKVKAIGINIADAGARSIPMLLDFLLGPGRPAILGWDVAGEVVAKAADVTGFEIGDPVLGLTEHGRGYAEYVAMRADLLALRPSNISYEEAAAVPIAGLTAWQPLMHGMQIKQGDTILIHAGSGGVGHYAIQIAKHLGATVITTTSAKNHDFVLSVGADRHIDYTAENFYDVVKDVDFVLDTMGGDILSHSIDVVKPGGTIISVVPPLTDELMQKARSKNVTLSLGMVQTNGSDIRAFATLMAQGIIKSHIAATYPFTNMAHAHTEVEKRRTVGKIVVKL